MLLTVVLLPLIALQVYTIRDGLRDRVQQELWAREELARSTGQGLNHFLEGLWTGFSRGTCKNRPQAG